MAVSSHWLQCGHVGPRTASPPFRSFETMPAPLRARDGRRTWASNRSKLVEERITNRAGEADAIERAVAAPKLGEDAGNETDKAPEEPEVLSTEVEVCIRTLAPESTYEMAISSLVREMESLARAASTGSRVEATPWTTAPAATVRIEVPLPRGVTALQWLKAQNEASMAVYFSSKMSSASDTEGSIVAESSFSSTASVAGLGHAWMWRGRHGCGLDSQTMAEIAAMTDDGLGKDNTGCSIKVLGGSRFDTGGKVGPEWDAFGSFCLLIPRIEFVERGNGCVLACTLAWDARVGNAGPAAAHAAREVYGFETMQDAMRDALRCISELKGMGARNSAGVIVAGGAEMVGSMRHAPDAAGWDALMEQVREKLCDQGRGEGGESSVVDSYAVQPTAALDEYLRNGQQGLDDLLAASKTSPNVRNKSTHALNEAEMCGSGQSAENGSAGADPESCPSTSKRRAQDGLVKLVLARKTTLVLNNELNCCDLLEAIQEKDPKAYQFMLRLATHETDTGAQRTFLGCTPERLYCRTDRRVVSEAVAGTRGRGPGGDIEKDFWLAFDLLQSQKDGLEFQLVRESIMDTFETLCDRVELEVDKSVLKQGSVQHLYGRIAGSLKAEVTDLDLVRELHPTPAVCGQPDQDAMCLLRSFESFDRGFYAGPFGWFSKHAADVAVAIRSTLVGADCVDLYAGVGIVPGSITSSEWNELDLKISQFTNLLKNSTQERIMSSPNLSILAAQVMVEELCRCGCNTFCIAPGSRSSPLTFAVSTHPRARLVPGIDERSLGFWALGHGKATGRPCAVITSSGTAVANLLPAVVEASQSNVPLLLLTADRPAELRDSGANQTIDQVGIFGKYVRWEADLLPPSVDTKLRPTLAAVSNGVRIATSRSNSGPVHLNCQFREPLHPVAVEWDNGASRDVPESAPAAPLLHGLDAWIADDRRRPFTIGASSNAGTSGALAASTIDMGTLQKIMKAAKGLIVVGELADPEDVSAAKQIASQLRWPIVGDVLSGLRIGGGSIRVEHQVHGKENGHGVGLDCEEGEPDFHLINYMDHVLLGGSEGSSDALWNSIKPDVILHLGSRITSKRLLAFLEWATQQDQPASWILANRKTTRYDPANVLDVRVDCSVVELHCALTRCGIKRPESHEYALLLGRLDAVVRNAITSALDGKGHLMSEAHVARTISECLPEGHGLFVGNSMPIRDLDMFGALRGTHDGLTAALDGAPIAANRGASGIDGVLSSALGFADGLQRKCTLVIGDVSFIHDTNGLNLLRTGGMSPALTVVLINNSGGGIFNFLPIASEVPDEQFRPLWTTPQYVDIAGMCRAQGIPHMRVTNLAELETSLKSSWDLNRHCVFEVVTSIESNVKHHEDIKRAVRCALDGGLAGPSDVDPGNGAWSDANTVIKRVRVKTESLPLKKLLTTTGGKSYTSRDVAYILMDAVCPDGSSRSVIGEIAPLPGLHRETMEDAVEQVTILAQHLQLRGSGVALSPSQTGEATPGVGCMAQGADAHKGSESGAGPLFQSFIESLGIPLDSVYPSVSCGIEAALYQLQVDGTDPATNPTGATLVSALINPHGKSEQMITAEAQEIVTTQGYGCIKVKAGRAEDAETDAAYLRVIRKAVGRDITLRVDANQSWTSAQAAAYVELVGDLDVEYLEEPLANPSDLFHWDAPGVPIALDESIDQGVFDLLDERTLLPAAVQVVVLKPSLVGGLSKTLALAQRASSRGLCTVISSSFESPLGLLHLSQIASAVDGECLATDARQAHGISTESWFQGDHSGLTSCARGFKGRLMPSNVRLEYAEAISLVNGETLEVKTMSFSVATRHVDWNVTQAIAGVTTSNPSSQTPPIVLVHGMFGSAMEMHELACALRQSRPGTPIFGVDLPGHGQSKWTQRGLDALNSTEGPNMLDLMSEALDTLLLDDRIGPCVLVGYSLGARLAMSTCLRNAPDDASNAPRGASNVLQLFTLSGGLGIATDNPAARAGRVEKDDAIAHAFETLPRRAFFDSWYGARLWDSMRAYPGFEKYVTAKTGQTLDPQRILAATLRSCSPGHVAPLREALDRSIENETPKKLNTDIVMMVGEQDATYLEMASTLNTSKNEYLTLETVQGAGHAMHLEAPDTVAALIAHHVARVLSPR